MITSSISKLQQLKGHVMNNINTEMFTQMIKYKRIKINMILVINIQIMDINNRSNIKYTPNINTVYHNTRYKTIFKIQLMTITLFLDYTNDS